MSLTEILKTPVRKVATPIKRAIRDAECARHVREIKASLQVPDKSLCVSYAHVDFPNPLSESRKVVQGGAVKYRYLSKRFPHSGLSFSILYAVSSSHCACLGNLIPVVQQHGARVVWNQNGVYHPQTYSDATWLNTLMSRPYKQADWVFYQSQFCRDTARLFLGERAGPGEILYNAIDTKLFVPAVSKPRNKHEICLLMAGTHHHNYRVLTGIRTLAELRRVRPGHLVIIGGMIKEVEIAAHQLVADLGLEDHVDFLGPYKQNEAPLLLQRGDIYLHTQYLDHCPSAVIEAMACGLPIVYSKTGGTPELVGESAGLGVPAEVTWTRNIPPSPDQLAICALQIADDLVNYACAARERAVTHFDLEPWLGRHEEVFEMLRRSAW